MERVQGEVWLYPCFPSSRVAQCTAHTHRPLWPVISSAEDNKMCKCPTSSAGQDALNGAHFSCSH